MEGIAIIGLGGRFPSADSVDGFWRSLCNGDESISYFADDELDHSIAPELVRNSKYVKARGTLENVEMFDAAFFGINKRAAEITDPQHKVFLEVAWEALESAGYAPEKFDGLIGVFAGMGNNTYFHNNVSHHQQKLDVIGHFQAMLANEKDFLTTTVSYKLNLNGPSVNVNTACSTSLVAVCSAFDSLLSYQCDIALAGGVSIVSPQNSGYLYEEGMIASKDGHCRPFDESANGTVFGNGAGIVVLKRIEDAVKDNDCIYAVIRGTGINNDGSGKMNFMAPSINGQAEAIAMAQASGGIDPDTISYIEAHGTGTPIGDPIEISALASAFNSKKASKKFCAIGSLKGNIGHLDTAAGVVGLIKVALSLKTRKLPPSINFHTPNPKIDFENSPFYVNTELTEWKRDENPLRAGVSSFGIGGTNAHVVLEEAPEFLPDETGRSHHIITLSARSLAALDKMTENLSGYFKEHSGELHVADVAFTLQNGRRLFGYKRYFVCRNIGEAIEICDKRDRRTVGADHIESAAPDIIFIFSGQGSQYINMGRELYKQETIFRNAVNKCAHILKRVSNIDLFEIIWAENETEEKTTRLKRTEYTQPALFIIEYSLAVLWESWGVRPDAMIGHSIGEYVAACLAGVFSLNDAISLVAERGKLIQAQPEGDMLSVQLSADEASQMIDSGLSLAASNSPSLCVVAGETQKISAYKEKLDEESVVNSVLNTSHAFHSVMMDKAVPPFLDAIRKVKLNVPQKPYVSTVTGTWVKPEEATSPKYWSNHLRETVRFSEGIQTLLNKKKAVFIEVGPGTSGLTLTRHQTKSLKNYSAVASLNKKKYGNDEWRSFCEAIGQLWVAGVGIDWDSFYKNENRRRVPLPTYPFERRRCWLNTAPYSSEMVSIKKTGTNTQNAGSDDNVIEKALKAYDALEAFSVVCGDNNGAACVYYVVKSNFSVTVTELRNYLSHSQNGCKLPRFFIELDRSYISIDGEIDGKKLSPVTFFNRGIDGVDILLPQSTAEKVLVDIWKDVIGIDSVRVDDNFYELGGDSLLAMQALSLIRQRTGVKLSPHVILLDTLKQIAKHYFPETTMAEANERIEDLSSSTTNPVERRLFFFGRSQKQLMGIYYPSKFDSGNGVGVVLCCPIGHEYLRSNWAFRRLANMLTMQGAHVLRFDYFATGDSAGDSTDGSIDQWKIDVRLAVDELKIMSGVSKVSIVGLRLGALLAAEALNECCDLRDLVLWDPINDGQTYINALDEMHHEMFPSFFQRLGRNRRVEYLGFPYSEGLLREIRKLRLIDIQPENVERICLIVSENTPEYRDYVDSISNSGLQIEYRVAPDAGHWNDFRKFDEALMVKDILNVIANSLTGAQNDD